MLCMLSNGTEQWFSRRFTGNFGVKKISNQTTNPNLPTNYIFNHQTTTNPNPPTNSSLGYASILPFFKGSPSLPEAPAPLVVQQGRLTSWDVPHPPARWKAKTRWLPWPGWRWEAETSHWSATDRFLNGGKYVSRQKIIRRYELLQVYDVSIWFYMDIYSPLRSPNVIQNKFGSGAYTPQSGLRRCKLKVSRETRYSQWLKAGQASWIWQFISSLSHSHGLPLT